MNIGIFDSGIGGVTLLHQALESLPNEKYLFYADTDNVPYGTKSREQVVELVDNVMRFMTRQGCKAVVIACNTATAAAADVMRQKYEMPIIGIEPAIKPAVAQSRGKRVLVAATPLTVREEKLKNLVKRVDDEHLVDLIALPGLVEFAERGEFASEAVERYLLSAFSGYALEKYGELVLGCTHFNYFKDSFRKIIPAQVSMIDGSEGTIKQLARVLESGKRTGAPQKDKNDTRVRYFRSGREITDADGLAYMKMLHDRLERMKHIQ
ncbi:MAG: glutamate racemase [Lachnospiraceae bacterium]|nr:glutamate racemase [Lachnospiraceae bacterium]